MKKNLTTIKVVIAVMALSFSFIACEEEFTTIGTNVIGSANFEVSSIGYDVVTYNKKLNPVQTNGLSSNLLGVYNDPIYGTSRANIVSQLVLNEYTTGTNIKLDSVVLRIPYFSASETDDEGITTYSLDSVYGNADATMRLSVYRNNFFLRDFDPDSNFEESQKYYSDGSTSDGNTIPQSELEFEEIAVIDDFNLSSEEIVLMELNDEGEMVETQTLEPSLRIVLTDEEDLQYWQETIFDKMEDTELSNSNNFKDYFRGIFLKLEQTEADSFMVMLNMASSSANIQMHYTSISAFDDEDEDAIPDTVDADIGNDGVTDDDVTDTDGDGIIDSADMDEDGDGEDDEGKVDINNDGFDDNSVGVINSSITLNFSGNTVSLYDNDFSMPLQDGDQINGDDKLYLKGGEGSMAIIDLFNPEDLDNNGISDELEDIKDFYRDDDGPIKIINEANLVFYEDESLLNPDDHENDRLYVYDVKNNFYLIDYSQDVVSAATPINSVLNHLGERYTDEAGNNKFKIRITEHINNLIYKDSTNTKLGMVISTNVNSVNNADILDTTEEDDLNKVPSGAVLSQQGTILYGNNASDPIKKVKLEIFFTNPNE